MDRHRCRFCTRELDETFVDLGLSPLANSYLPPERADATEPTYPLHARVCRGCGLVQLPQFEPAANIFDQYLYYSSYSESWLLHAEGYAAEMIARAKLGAASEVIEIASNDGYLLQYFQRAGIRALGIEPASGPAAAAIAKGIPTRTCYFGRDVATALRVEGHRPELIVANNVLPHVPDINDFVAGLRILLPETGRATLELPHLLHLIGAIQFDTIYHEHLSYFSLATLERVFRAHALRVFDVDELPTHGGSLRLHVCSEAAPPSGSSALESLRQRETAAGLDRPASYHDFQAKVAAKRETIRDFLVAARRAGRTVLAYGAPAKGNTLLNYCGVARELIPFTVDRNPHKQGLLLPGTHLPIRNPAALIAARPDYVFILPWNLKDEIIAQLAEVRAWGGQFVVPAPDLTIIS
ncbi:class I SAM-dependent methyltransferase [Bradyrhizobium liaoningense]|uniref:class I SAM-dependent methyltransferase n=1 Tax=Bradyrhizobium liaoningense TaxID=43992 RepID=UPI001BAD6D92|nr:class I SAM-dependent methyltransferase [Bradyrhizobium liaoningense]MBR0984730.1 methyltransferase domain-containing protein [Bradyrhizobium liaoningense]